MKNLLVATDLSARSDRAVNRALSLSDELNTRLVVLHVVDDELPSSIAERLKEQAELAIDEQLDAFPALKRENITRKVVFGSGHKEILQEAEESEAELIIMGIHRNESVAEFFIGTTAERVIRRGNLPVLLVKDRVRGPYRQVLVGIDFSVCSRRAVEFAVKLVPGCELSLVHAYDIPFKGFISAPSSREQVREQHRQQMDTMLDEEMQAFLASLPSKSGNFERIMSEGTVREVISDQVDKQRPDILVVGTHGRTGVARALLGGVAQDLLSNPPCDILAVKAW